MSEVCDSGAQAEGFGIAMGALERGRWRDWPSFHDVEHECLMMTILISTFVKSVFMKQSRDPRDCNE